jgi:hypothetical protein
VPCSTITGFDFAPGAEWRQRPSPEAESLGKREFCELSQSMRVVRHDLSAARSGLLKFQVAPCGPDQGDRAWTLWRDGFVS